jgi:hypothetical protein
MTSTQTAIVFIGMFEGILKHMLTLFVCFFILLQQTWNGANSVNANWMCQGPTQQMPIGCVEA